MRERQHLEHLEQSTSALKTLDAEFADARGLLEMAEAEGDDAMVADAESSIAALAARAEELKLESMLSGEADANDAYLEVHAGAGGTESQDWAEMLFRMYTRWRNGAATSSSFRGKRRRGRGAEIRHAAGEGRQRLWLAEERSGRCHRLVRISPFDSNARRHTSFSSVTIYPVIDQSIEIDIPEKDVRIDVYRASGAGGQHVNKTESAVRITHLPTGIAVACQTERSQHQNPRRMLGHAALASLRDRAGEEEAETGAFIGEKSDIGWGHQIRSYVLQPYQLVKDLRTGVESREPDKVLDGALDPFMQAALAQEIAASRKRRSAIWSSRCAPPCAQSDFAAAAEALQRDFVFFPAGRHGCDHRDNRAEEQGEAGPQTGIFGCLACVVGGAQQGAAQALLHVHHARLGEGRIPCRCRARRGA